MKYFSFLFSVYLLALSFVPCSDTAEIHDKNTILKTISHSNDTHSHTGVGDICSPFCVCACCHSQVSVTETTDIPEGIDSNKISHKEIIYLSHYQYINIDTFLDPPRIVS